MTAIDELGEIEESSKIDLTPWAAYVVGHHPHSLAIWGEGLWADIQFNGPKTEEQSWLPISTEIQELNNAMHILAVADRVKPAILCELHRMVDQFDSICNGMIERKILGGFETGIPGYTEAILMQSLSGLVLVPSKELQPWYQLGQALGSGQYWLRSVADVETDIPEDLKGLPVLIQRLIAQGHETLTDEIENCIGKLKLKRFGPKGSFKKRFLAIDNQYLAVAELHDKMRAALREQQAPEPILVLTHDSITFFGVKSALTEYRQSEMSCLRVLAEKAGTPVSREDIIREGSLQTDADGLKSVVSRLRKNLRTIATKYCDDTGNEQPAGFEGGFIRGSRGPQYESYKRGPYTLNLAPSRVRIDGPRPDWMKTKPITN